eukprot:gnl/TRDRNA2_/TRDRNA2_58445_c0_seq1.p1 gnl/TRDRNA2_/TRDRNA2_58445_c0~~gnl/TRDRNA2_/TRDRNA2_58445_c0_seq1.p1  ORF type:complete len:290 (-),score=70.66 gnl/TRDRNA2_/TRDRNA2_58445_c0_seq1:133-1002(-)
MSSPLLDQAPDCSFLAMLASRVATWLVKIHSVVLLKDISDISYFTVVGSLAIGVVASISCICLRRLRAAKRSKAPTSTEELRTLLEMHEIDTSQFGTGEAKSLDALLQELQDGSCSLDLVNGRIMRCVEPVFIELRYSGKILVEKSQVLPDGRLRQRNMLLAEKKQPADPNVVTVVLRALKEELDIDVTGPGKDVFVEGFVHRDDLYKVFREERDAASYPGIPCVYLTHHETVEIREGSRAASLFATCGLPEGCSFKTEEAKADGILKHQWDWIDFELAQQAGVKGLHV